MPKKVLKLPFFSLNSLTYSTIEVWIQTRLKDLHPRVFYTLLKHDVFLSLSWPMEFKSKKKKKIEKKKVNKETKRKHTSLHSLWFLKAFHMQDQLFLFFLVPHKLHNECCWLVQLKFCKLFLSILEDYLYCLGILKEQNQERYDHFDSECKIHQ